ncbi:hypothetical protein L249_0739 [Ophiocordyceps polyrhachis-furcata BCC 54312]|uniref:Uncharacterized protein n=1 Tax=Ophiocordyceps polyrhachis-furcata BCC 54312 TaxID=1330021 RepID=A0A367LDY2_9HYPO|nr:hypothetical protein L249_0739 [Ophiocordyceps polyrhachis-furcata BCC 54312]
MGSSHSLHRKTQHQEQNITDDDIKKYTGKTRAELNAWADSQPGIGKNQLAGKMAMGPASGVGAGMGCGGWGPGAEPSGADRGMKFPPKSATEDSAD